MSKDDKNPQGFGESVSDLQVIAAMLSQWIVEVYDKPVILNWLDKKYKEIVNEIADKIIEEEKRLR